MRTFAALRTNGSYAGLCGRSVKQYQGLVSPDQSGLHSEIEELASRPCDAIGYPAACGPVGQ